MTYTDRQIRTFERLFLHSGLEPRILKKMEDKEKTRH